MTSLDTNVSNYTLSELLTIAELDNDEDINEETVLTNTNKFIDKFKYKKPELAVFFKEDNKWYRFEHSWYLHKGLLGPYNTLKAGQLEMIRQMKSNNNRFVKFVDLNKVLGDYELIGEKLKVPALAYSIKRVSIGEYSCL
jgi:hypothetical protein